MKVVINRCYGGFSLSEAAIEMYKLKSGIDINRYDVDRNDPLLIEVVEELGVGLASGAYAKLRIVEIPDTIEWEVDEYDGMESIEEKHNSWY